VNFLFHVKHDDDALVIREQAAGLGVELSDRQARSLICFEELLRERAVPAGLVGGRDASRLRERHLLDCLRAVGVVTARDRVAYDLGSGAGLPGVVVAIATPGLRVVLVEGRQRRVAFLELTVERLRLQNASVFAGRIEEIGERGPASAGTGVDLCFARALAPLPEAWRLAQPLLGPEGRLVYFGGRGLAEDLAVPGARVLEVRPSAVLERAGPLVIMAR
jgi:16S rRNA (guanine527-N7)-methyltransferase